jgi:hypothetical protein
MKNKNQGSFKVLMILILVMYISETARVALDWYLGWLTYITFSGSDEQAVAGFLISEETPLNIAAVGALLVTIKLSIADSIMVFHFIFCLFCNSDKSFANYIGLALLDHLQS